MRISDWSSDVCSSDLRCPCGQLTGQLKHMLRAVIHEGAAVECNVLVVRRHDRQRARLEADFVVITQQQSALSNGVSPGFLSCLTVKCTCRGIFSNQFRHEGVGQYRITRAENL